MVKEYNSKTVTVYRSKIYKPFLGLIWLRAGILRIEDFAPCNASTSSWTIDEEAVGYPLHYKVAYYSYDGKTVMNVRQAIRIKNGKERIIGTYFSYVKLKKCTKHGIGPDGRMVYLLIGWKKRPRNVDDKTIMDSWGN